MDIVERLCRKQWFVFDSVKLFMRDTTPFEAADEIERLRGKLAEVTEQRDWSNKFRKIKCEENAEEQLENERLREALHKIADTYSSFYVGEMARAALKETE